MLESHGLRAKRSFGQNFLMDAQLAARIAELATTPCGGTVVEIGAGTGALTGPLLERAARVIAIERDRDLVPVLRETFTAELDSGQLALLEADAKSCDFVALLAGTPRPRVVAGNLPYQLTGPLLEKVTHSAGAIERAVFLVQLEVADRLNATPQSGDYGALSVFVQNRFECRRAFVVRRGAFFPQPGVDSAVITLTPLGEPMANEDGVFRQLVRGAFAQRRKTLRNAWHGLPGVAATELEAAARAAGSDLSLRGETLSVAQFARMAHELEA